MSSESSNIGQGMPMGSRQAARMALCQKIHDQVTKAENAANKARRMQDITHTATIKAIRDLQAACDLVADVALSCTEDWIPGVPPPQLYDDASPHTPPDRAETVPASNTERAGSSTDDIGNRGDPAIATDVTSTAIDPNSIGSTLFTPGDDKGDDGQPGRSDGGDDSQVAKKPKWKHDGRSQ